MIMDQIRWRIRAYKYRTRKKCEADEIDFVCRSIRPGQTAVDIGAYKGAFTYWMQKRTGRTGKVFAFEPQPSLAQLLSALTAPTVQVEPMAVSDTEGEAELMVPLAPGNDVSQLASLSSEWNPVEQSENVHRWTVKTTSLDQYFAHHEGRPVSFIKCDAEGHELKVFQGAEQILREDRPKLMFESSTFEDESAQQALKVFRFLWSLDYVGYSFDRTNSQLVPIDEDPDRVPRNYSHNLVFVPREQGL